MAGGYRFLDHMTDAVIEAYGSTLAESFENAALGLNDTMINVKTVRSTNKVTICVSASDLKELLFEFLDRVMLILLVERFAMCSFHVQIAKAADSYSLNAVAEGEQLDVKKHGYKVEIKAVTYHEMEILQKENETTVRFILDL